LRRVAREWGLAAALSVAAFLMLAPFIVTLANSFMTESEIAVNTTRSVRTAIRANTPT